MKKRIESNPSQAARLLCILVSCYSVPEREFTRLSQILKSPTKEMVTEIWKNQPHKTEYFERIYPVMSELERSKYQLKERSEFDELRVSTKLETLIERSLANELSRSDFPFIG